ncbi:hypothetical protein Tco_0295644 [Tanacetum coccineum]
MHNSAWGGLRIAVCLPIGKAFVKGYELEGCLCELKRSTSNALEIRLPNQKQHPSRCARSAEATIIQWAEGGVYQDVLCISWRWEDWCRRVECAEGVLSSRKGRGRVRGRSITAHSVVVAAAHALENLTHSSVCLRNMLVSESELSRYLVKIPASGVYGIANQEQRMLSFRISTIKNQRRHDLYGRIQG